MLDGFLHHGGDAFVAFNVHFQGQGFTTLFSDLIDPGGKKFHGTAGQHDRRAFLSVRQGNPIPDPFAGARDHGNFSGEFLHGGFPLEQENRRDDQILLKHRCDGKDIMNPAHLHF